MFGISAFSQTPFSSLAAGGVQFANASITATATVTVTTSGSLVFGNAVINGRNDYQPKVRSILSTYGNEVITSLNHGDDNHHRVTFLFNASLRIVQLFLLLT